MKWPTRIVLLILIIGITISPVVSATWDSVVVIARPRVSGGITDFTLTYVSVTQVDFSWSVFGDVDNVMIRGKYNAYPTSVTDGYQIYYGSDTSCSDTSVNFDENPATLYVTAFAQRSNGTYYTDIDQAEQESIPMTLLAGIFLVLALNALAFWQRNIFLYLIICPVDVVYGLYKAADATVNSSDWVVGVIISIIGIFCLYRASMKLLSKEE